MTSVITVLINKISDKKHHKTQFGETSITFPTFLFQHLLTKTDLVSNLKNFSFCISLFKQRNAFYFKYVTVGVWLKCMGGGEEISVCTEMQHTPTTQVE